MCNNILILTQKIKSMREVYFSSTETYINLDIVFYMENVFINP